MSDVSVIRGGAIARFDPKQTKQRIAKADAVISYATTIQDWPLLEEAAEAKMDEQAEYIAWWGGNVSVRESPGGVDRASNADRRSMVSKADAERDTGISQQQVSRWRNNLADRDRYRQRITDAAYRKADLKPGVNRHSIETGEHHWFTPPQYVEAARTVMGAIDLDPATHVHAQCTVGAGTFYTASDDGLTKPWHGRVWLNPPYEAQLIDLFVRKMTDEYDAGRMTQGVLLTHNNTDTRWFHAAQSKAALLCFTLGRIRFIDFSGNVGDAPTQGHVFFYFGVRVVEFRDTFSAFGFVR